jgi:hypothetical protein
VRGWQQDLRFSKAVRVTRLCALSSNNVMAVAKWVKQTGLSDLFSGVVIATDHDIGRTEAGRLKSNAIPRALEAAKVTGFALAVPPANSQVGADARDLLGQGGPRPYVTSLPALHRLPMWRKRGLTFFCQLKSGNWTWNLNLTGDLGLFAFRPACARPVFGNSTQKGRLHVKTESLPQRAPGVG